MASEIKDETHGSLRDARRLLPETICAYVSWFVNGSWRYLLGIFVPIYVCQGVDPGS